MAMGLLKPFLDERTLQKFSNGSMYAEMESGST
jgi:hypothetical protein